MKKVVVSNDEEMHMIPECNIMEAVEQPDGSTNLAYVCMVNVKESIDEIREQMSESRIPR